MQANTQIDKLRAELKDSKITDREGFLKLYQEYLKSLQKTDSNFQEFSKAPILEYSIESRAAQTRTTKKSKAIVGAKLSVTGKIGKL